VAFPLIGVVQAGAHTTEEVTREITGRLAGAYVNDPRVSVEVLNYRPFYILGEVNKPGEYPYASGMTVDQAIAKAGGLPIAPTKRRSCAARPRPASIRRCAASTRWRSCRARSAWGNATSDRRVPCFWAMMASSRRGRRCGLLAGQRVAGSGSAAVGARGRVRGFRTS
jgi:hypothetical protein